MLNIGHSDNEFLIQSPVVMRDALGAPYSTWVDYVTVYAEIEGGEVSALETGSTGPRRELSQSMTLIFRCHPSQVFGPEQRAINTTTGVIYAVSAVRYDYRRTKAFMDITGGVSAGGVP